MWAGHPEHRHVDSEDNLPHCLRQTFPHLYPHRVPKLKCARCHDSQSALLFIKSPASEWEEKNKNPSFSFFSKGFTPSMGSG